MPPVEGDGYTSEITEWWGGEGYPQTIHDGRGSEYHHKGEPTDDELLNEATKLTVRVTYDNGDVVHYTRHSPDGWTESELESDLVDSGDYYESAISTPAPDSAPEPPRTPRAPPSPRAPTRRTPWRSAINRVRTAWRNFWRQ